VPVASSDCLQERECLDRADEDELVPVICNDGASDDGDDDGEAHTASRVGEAAHPNCWRRPQGDQPGNNK
jgi:hypothetical protein